MEIKHVTDIQKQLCLPFNCGPGTLNKAQLLTRLSNKNLRPLKFIFSDLHESNMIRTEQGFFVSARTKCHFATLLVKWCLSMPLISANNVSKTCTTETLQYIQHVIKTTSTPSWIHSISTNYGEASVGSIKADECTVYLPIALVTLWGDQDGTPPSEGSHFLKLLDHMMALFQVATLVVLYTMNSAHAQMYYGLHMLHPHTKQHKQRVNVHAVFHVYDFLFLFGPCFSFERLIGALQKINTNDIVGGEFTFLLLIPNKIHHVLGPLEQTMLWSHMRAAGLRWWLRRPECLEVIKQFKALFDKAFLQGLSVNSRLIADAATSASPSEVAHYTYNSVNFLCSSTHLGNSLMLYYPSPSSVMPVAGSIKKIMSSSRDVELSVKHQVRLPPGSYDLFSRYPSFPARVYSLKMDNGLADRVSFELVVSHVARFTFSSNCAVILNLSRVHEPLPFLLNLLIFAPDLASQLLTLAIP
ncbi:hypothetical protein Hypma_010457 [Hypsizygus marmoreus]|uniref:Uncharacterized protein n=1 Tax=Hypsizygus marmoreus TaxID=39966 RepID=A0A369KBF1_HYPMA|nr:hypothetical protein Hypma_010457 [Hypsizygus marmoreus]